LIISLQKVIINKHLIRMRKVRIRAISKKISEKQLILMMMGNKIKIINNRSL